MKKLFKTLSAVAIALMAFAACGKEDQPGNGGNGDNGGNGGNEVTNAKVYFSNANPDLIIIESANTSVDVVVCRSETEKDLTIKVNATKKSDEVNVPESVSFKAGENQALLRLTFPANTEAGTVYNVELELVGADIFQAEGNTTYSVMLANPERIKARTTPYYSIDEIGEWYTDVMKISDKLWILPNFWNSGIDVTLTGGDEVGDGQILLGVTATKGYHETETITDGGVDYVYDCWWFYENAEDGETYYLYPFGEEAGLKLQGGFFFNSENRDYGNYSFYNPASKRIELEFDFYAYRSESGKWGDFTYEFFSLRMGESALAGFEPYLPEYKEVGSTTPIKAYFESDPSTVYNWEGYWDEEDPYKFVVLHGASGMTYYADVTFTLSNPDCKLVDISSKYITFYEDETYGNYWYSEDYFNIFSNYYVAWIYPDENTCYDYDSNTFKLYMGYGLYSDANDYNEDVLVLELQD